MGRELRKVPANWEHPKDEKGQYIPMFNIYYGDLLKEWLAENEAWDNGTQQTSLAAWGSRGMGGKERFEALRRGTGFAASLTCRKERWHIRGCRQEGVVRTRSHIP